MAIEIKVGQIWRETDPLRTDRFLLVQAMDDTSVWCKTLKTGVKTTIRKSRMKPGSKGYALVTDQKILAQMQAQHGLTPPTVAKEASGRICASRLKFTTDNYLEFMAKVTEAFIGMGLLRVAPEPAS